VKIINDILAYCGISITEDILKYLLTAPRFVLDDLNKDETIKILKDKIGSLEINTGSGIYIFSTVLCVKDVDSRNLYFISR